MRVGARAGEAPPPLRAAADIRREQRFKTQLPDANAPRGQPPARLRPATGTRAWHSAHRFRRPGPLPCAPGPPSPRTPRRRQGQSASASGGARPGDAAPALRLTSHCVAASLSSLLLCARTWPQKAADTTSSQPAGQPETMLPMPGRTARLLAAGRASVIREPVGRKCPRKTRRTLQEPVIAGLSGAHDAS